MFYTNYLRLCASIQKAPTTVATELGLKRATVTRWKGGALPTDINLQKIADYFGVTVDYLLGHADERTPARRETASSPRKAISREDAVFALAGDIDVELDPEDIDDVEEYVQLVAARAQKRKQKKSDA